MQTLGLGLIFAALGYIIILACLDEQDCFNEEKADALVFGSTIVIVILFVLGMTFALISPSRNYYIKQVTEWHNPSCTESYYQITLTNDDQLYYLWINDDAVAAQFIGAREISLTDNQVNVLYQVDKVREAFKKEEG